MSNQKRNPVAVKQIFGTKDPETVQLLLSQEVEREITSSNGLLGLTMEGHESFKTGSTTTRTCFQNFSKAALEKYGLSEGSILPEDWNATIVVREFVSGEELDADSKKLLGKATHFIPWRSADGSKKQLPKTQGEDGPILTYNGQEIYRNYYLSVKGMPTTDKFIEHNGVKEVERVNTTSNISNVSMP